MQEVIVQNFRAKPGTRMAVAPGAVARGPPLDDRRRAHPARAALARAGAAEPRLRRLSAPARRRHRRLGRCLAGDDRPRQPGGAVARARAARGGDARAAGSSSRRGSPSTRSTSRELERWVDPAVAPYVRRAADAVGLAREDAWAPGEPGAIPFVVAPRRAPARALERRARRGRAHAAPLRARRGARSACSPPPTRCGARSCGDEVTYVVTRNIQYTNVCYFRCGFCAFSKGKLAANLRGAPYLVPLEEIVRRARGGVGARRDRGLPPGRDPSGVHGRLLRGRRARDQGGGAGDPRARVLRARGLAGRGDARARARRVPGAPARPRARLAARHRRRGARRRGAARHLPGQGDDRAVARRARRGAPGRAALERDDHVRPRGHAAELGAAPPARARAAAASGGFTEFVPLPFVPMEAPMYVKGRARRGPTFRETLLVHAVARLALHPWITNVQASWVKLGPDGTREALRAGVNDLGGTLMNESISRSAGAGVRAGAAAGADGGADPLRRPRCRASGRRSTASRRRSACARRSARRRSPSRSTRRCRRRASSRRRGSSGPGSSARALADVDHLALAVSDQERSRRFYERYFGFTAEAEPREDGVLILHDAAGFSLALGADGRADPCCRRSSTSARGSRVPEDVRAFRDRLVADGVEIVDWWDEPDYVSVKFRDPDGYVVEVSWEYRPPQHDAGSRPSSAGRLAPLPARAGIGGGARRWNAMRRYPARVKSCDDAAPAARSIQDANDVVGTEGHERLRSRELLERAARLSERAVRGRSAWLDGSSSAARAPGSHRDSIAIRREGAAQVALRRAAERSRTTSLLRRLSDRGCHDAPDCASRRPLQLVVSGRPRSANVLVRSSRALPSADRRSCRR